MDLTEIEKRLTVLEDIREIEKLQSRYIYALTNLQLEDVVDCFTENGTTNVYTHGLQQGKAQMLKMFKEEISHMNMGLNRDGHFAIQPIIEVDGNKAIGSWLMYVMILDPVTGKAQKWFNGKYDNTYEKVDGKWKISSLKWTYPWPVTPDSYPK
jgi:ketosteroid isomerase-like protein